MDTFIAIAICLGGCGARNCEDDRPCWLDDDVRRRPSSSSSTYSEMSTTSLPPYSPPFRDISTIEEAGEEEAGDDNKNRSDSDANERDIAVVAQHTVRVLLTGLDAASIDARLANIRASVTGERGPVTTAGWKDGLATAILESLVKIIKMQMGDTIPVDRDDSGDSGDSGDNKDKDGDNGGEQPSPCFTAIRDWVYKTATEIFQWSKDHPQLATFLAFVAAVAILYLLGPWVLEAIGFAEEGPVLGMLCLFLTCILVLFSCLLTSSSRVHRRPPAETLPRPRAQGLLVLLLPAP